jgi:predicted dehydrogenase
MENSARIPKYRAAVIACGRISGAHASGYIANPGIELIACADISSEALEKFGTAYKIPQERRYLNYEQMMDRERPDLVSICSLHHLHAPMTIAVAAYKPKAILCEKPIALSLGEADAMIDACKRSGTLLIIGHQRRFCPQYIAAYNALKAGEIGELVTIETHGHPGCSLLVDGTHTVDLIRWFADESPIEWVMGQIDVRERRTAWGSYVENAAFTIYRFQNGVRAFMTLGHLLSSKDKTSRDPLWPDVPPGSYHLFTLRGTKGEIQIDGDAPVEGRPWVRLIKDGVAKEIPLEWQRRGNPDKSPHALLTQAIIDSLEKGVPHTLEATSARATLEVLMAVYESSRRRAIVELPLEISENPMFEMIGV